MKLSRRNLMRGFGLSAAGAALGTAAGDFSATDLSAESLSPPTAARIRLDTTRKAYGPPAGTTAVMQQSLPAAGEYLDDEAAALRSKIADHHGVSEAQVVVGCGSGEILRMSALAFTGTGQSLVLGVPTCQLMGRYAARAGAELLLVPLDKTYAHDLSAMAARATDARAGLVYICNPNNPTGTLTRRPDLDAFLETLPPSVHVLIDEAHHPYVERTAETVSFLERRMDDDRVIVARSFSKIYGLAGLRVGYAVTTSRTARLLELHQVERNLNAVGARAAALVLDDTAHVTQSVRRNTDDRQEFVNQVHARGLRAIASQTNFVMLDTERPANTVIDHMQQHHIVLAPTFLPFERHVRVSLGRRAEMTEFWRVWDLMPRVSGHRM